MFTRQSLGFIAAIVAIMVFVGISAMSVAEAGGVVKDRPTNIRFEVTPSIKTASGTWSNTVASYRSVETVELERGTRYQPGMTASSERVTLGPNPLNVTIGSYPSYYSDMMWLNYPDGTRNAFMSTQWFSSNESCDAPKVSVSITNPRTSSATAKAVIDNRDGRNKLFVSEDGHSWMELQFSDFYEITPRQIGEFIVSTSPESDLSKRCAVLQWNVTPAWIEGTPTPTATPSPTATPTRTPTPVRQTVLASLTTPNVEWSRSQSNPLRLDVRTSLATTFSYRLTTTCPLAMTQPGMSGTTQSVTASGRVDWQVTPRAASRSCSFTATGLTQDKDKLSFQTTTTVNIR